jgi:hypothetical protein
MTGIVGCARAVSGHAAAPPRSVMNSRRFIRVTDRRPFVRYVTNATGDKTFWQIRTAADSN